MKRNGMHSHSFPPSTTAGVVLRYFLAIQLHKTITTEEDVRGLVLVKEETLQHGFPPMLSLRYCGLRNGDVVRS